MKIYTKKGDKGETSLIGGSRVPKHHLRIECYGTIDELNAWIGLLRDQPINPKHLKLLVEIQDRLFTIGSLLASDAASKMKLPELKEEDITLLEKAIDAMEAALPSMKHFVLPGGHTLVSYCHITRCVCRRAERLAAHLASTGSAYLASTSSAYHSESEVVSALVLKYLNRLSDYLFVLARSLAHELRAKETIWKPRIETK